MKPMTWKKIAEYPNWEISDSGRVRMIKNVKKYAKEYKDRLDRTVVVVTKGDTEYVEYVNDLIALVFHKFTSNQTAVVPSKHILAVLPSDGRDKVRPRKAKRVRNIDTDTIYNSFAEAARILGYDYDKFYDSVNLSGSYQGERWERLDTKTVRANYLEKASNK